MNVLYTKNDINPDSIIGRISEKKELDYVLNSEDSELMFLYGRRRIGKTFLIHNYCGNKGMYFYFRAEEHSTMIFSITNFINEIIESFKRKGIFLNRPSNIYNWTDCFSFFYDQIRNLNERIIILIDEFPWFCTQKSHFLDSFSYFWNKQASNHSNIKILSTGSATSFLLNKIIKNKKGLFSRLKSLKMRPFTLEETNLFLLSRKVHFHNKKDTILAYMVFGGVPQYLKEIRPGQSMEEVINRCFFGTNPIFGLEFKELFEGTFSNFELHTSIIDYINFSKKGKTQSEIYAFLKKTYNKEKERYNGSQLKMALQDLVESDLINKVKFLSFDERAIKDNNPFYKISDEFLLFNSYWVTNNPMIENENYWSNVVKSQDISSWSGEAFERLCLKHLSLIFNKMRIYCNISGYWWKNFDDPHSKEIDLLVDRDDKIYSIIEIKYYEKEYNLDSNRKKIIIDKLNYFNSYKSLIKENQHNKKNKKKDVNILFLTANGMSKNKDYQDVPIANDFKITDLI